ncbi:MAG: hypothetical protein ACK4FL_01005 [Microgenomates group bacterium]
MTTLLATSTLRNNLADVLNELSKKKDFFLVTKNGNPISAIVNLDFFEDLLALGNRKYLKSIKEARKQYKKGQTYSFAEVFGKL